MNKSAPICLALRFRALKRPHIADSEDLLGVVAGIALRKKLYAEKFSVQRNEVPYSFGEILLNFASDKFVKWKIFYSIWLIL